MPGLGTSLEGRSLCPVLLPVQWLSLGKLVTFIRQWQTKAGAHSRATRKEMDSEMERWPVCASALTESQRGEERHLPCWGMCALWTASQNWQWSTVTLKQRFCEALEVSHEHRAVTPETGTAFIFCPPHPAAPVNGAGRAHCNIHVICACRAAGGGREDSCAVSGRTGVSLGWESDPEWKEQVAVMVGEEQMERTLLTPADSLCLRSSEGFQMHPCSLG